MGRAADRRSAAAVAVDDDSRRYKLFGQNARSIIVGILFVITLAAFMVCIIAFRQKLSESITTGFFALLSGFAGFFVATL